MRFLNRWMWWFFAVCIVFTKGAVLNVKDSEPPSDDELFRMLSAGSRRTDALRKANNQESSTNLKPCEGYGETRFCDVPDEEYPTDAISKILLEHFAQRKPILRVNMHKDSSEEEVYRVNWSDITHYWGTSDHSCFNKTCFYMSIETSCVEKTQTIRKATIANRTNFIVSIRETYLQKRYPRFLDKSEMHTLGNFDKADLAVGREETQIVCLGAHSVCTLDSGQQRKCKPKYTNRPVGIVDVSDKTIRMEFLHVPDGCECTPIWLY